VWDQLQHAAGRDPLIAVRPGWDIRVHPAARRSIEIPQRDPPQVAELNAFIASCRPHMVLLDIGAHYGLFSLAALHYGGAGARAVAVEASGAAAGILETHGRLNGAGGRLRVVHAAAADQPGWRAMLPVGVIADGYYVEPEPDRAAGDLVRVPAVTVDGLVDELGLMPTHLKIDVEGAEAMVLRGAQRTLSAALPPLVFLELHNYVFRRSGRDPAECLAQLSRLGYRFQDSKGSRLTVEHATQPELIRLVARREAL
jgi:FkbM family methyltransferase